MEEITIEDIEKDLAPDRYINPFKGKKYLEFLLAKYQSAETKIRELEEKLKVHK